MNEANKSLFLWGGVILGIIALVILLAIFGNSSSDTNATLESNITTNDHTDGFSNAKIKIVTYSDFQCPGCASTYPMTKQLVAAFPEDVSLTYRHYPLRQIHTNAQLAGQATEAASMQDNFWEMHDVLFNTQNQWSNLGDPTEFFTKLAESIGLDVVQFTTDLTSAEATESVNNDYNDANKMNLPGTPSFFINGTLIEHPGSYAGFKSLIEAELTK
jgi:protein-disulfide isomerase